MAWPLPFDLRAALKDPRTAFRDPRLQACTLETTETGEPRAWTGASAVVYKAIPPDGTPLAIRTFDTELLERRERFQWIAEYLKDHRPPCLVDFQYDDSGVRLPGDPIWYPLMVMDWVEGATLYQYVRRGAWPAKEPRWPRRRGTGPPWSSSWPRPRWFTAIWNPPTCLSLARASSSWSTTITCVCRRWSDCPAWRPVWSRIGTPGGPPPRRCRSRWTILRRW